MKNLKISLIQSNLHWENKEENIKMFNQKIAQISDSDIILLPEMWSTGFSMNPQLLANENANLELEKMKEWSKQSNAVIVGSVMNKVVGEFFNSLFWVNQDEVEQYDKFHLFSYGNEHETYTAGNKPFTEVIYQGWKIRLQTCYDLRFPESARNTTQYDVLIYVANWPERRAQHWNALLKARAIENQAVVLAVNRIGIDGNGVSHSGCSQVISPLGEILQFSEQQEGILTSNLSKQLFGIRDNFQVLNDIK